ncbi:hypothetical protein ACFXPX_36365 [Kitasatospora sp. NPDC059146]|uniref:hypothetical protein n=1 Tax=Kitasatospora sp. NPDC059146 TaxID=3346741 RepID=UPI0036A3FC98
MAEQAAPWYRTVSGRVWIAGAAVVVLGAGLTVAAVTRDDGPTGGAGTPAAARSGPAGHRIVLPDRIGEQARLPGDDSSALRASYEERTKVFKHRDLTAGTYSPSGAPGNTLTVIGLTGSYPNPGGKVAFYFDDLARSDVFRDDSVQGLQDYPAGPLGGVLRCATLNSATATQSTCVWADGDTVGIVVDEKGAARPDDLAKRALEIRTAVEVEG